MVYEYTLKEGSEAALALLINLMHRIENSPLHNPFQEKCFIGIREGNHPQTHLRILLGMCHSKLEFFDKIELDLMGILTDYLVKQPDNNRSKELTEGFELLG